MLTDMDVRYCISLLFTQLIMNSFCYSFIQFTDFSVELNEFQCFDQECNAYDHSSGLPPKVTHLL